MHGFFRIVSILLIGTQISAVSISEILTSFNEVIDYYFKNPDFVDLSGFFGLVRAEALIADVFLKNDTHMLNLSLSKKKCVDFLKTRKKTLEPHDDWMKNISDPMFWRTKISYKLLYNKCFRVNKNKTVDLLEKLRNEAETACITPEMFEFCVNNLYHVEKLNIHSGCNHFIFGNYKGIGYETTHRLFLLQILKTWNFFPNIPEHLFWNLCEFIYQQAVVTQGNFIFFDLFIEQVFLCGAEGYIEFLNVKWLEKILENQLEEGCFPLFSKKLNTSAFFKRRCSDHATGLAIATLALHINFRSYSIKNNHYS